MPTAKTSNSAKLFLQTLAVSALAGAAVFIILKVLIFNNLIETSLVSTMLLIGLAIGLIILSANLSVKILEKAHAGENLEQTHKWALGFSVSTAGTLSVLFSPWLAIPFLLLPSIVVLFAQTRKVPINQE